MHQKKKKKPTSEFFDALREMNKNHFLVTITYFVLRAFQGMIFLFHTCCEVLCEIRRENTSFVQSELRKIIFYSINLSMYEIRSDVLWYDVV